MTDQQRLALRAALAFHHALVRHMMHRDVGVLPETAWEECRRLLRMIEKARRRSWNGAAGKLERSLDYRTLDCREKLLRLQTCLEERHSAKIVAAREIFADLLALKAEFGNVRINHAETTIAADTEPIVLQGVELGGFRIRLDWSKLDYARAYEILSLDPHPASSCSDVTHPHMRYDVLCEGDGEVPIRRALKQGRLLEFFLIVRQILATYNPRSAHVKLEDWNSKGCSDCGEMVRETDLCCCERCAVKLCRRCSTSCTRCDQILCRSHVDDCEHCGENYCHRCLAACHICDGTFCKECLDDATCPSCRQDEQNLDAPADDDEETDERDEDDECDEDEAEESYADDAASGCRADAPAPVHTVRMGQAGVPA